MKASNKYLFDQTVQCSDCKHSTRDYGCRLNPRGFNDYHKNRYVNIVIVRLQVQTDIVTKYCGPIGKYYEPKE